MKRRLLVLAAGTSLMASTVVGAPVIAGAQARPAAGKVFTVKLTLKQGEGKRVILLSKSGRALAAAKASSNDQLITLRTPSKGKISSIAGATLQLVNSTGEYFGPVVLSWQGPTSKKLSQSTAVYEKLAASTATTITLGVHTVTSAPGSLVQGYAKPVARSQNADTSTQAATKAVRGRPIGVGSYGKSRTDTVNLAGRHVAARSAGPPPPPVSSPENTLGGDVDQDGIPSAFDVNDDGDAKVDASDASTPSPTVAPDASTAGGTACPAVNFSIFTNFKATQPGFAGSINYYAPGDFQATPTKIADAISRTMTMVFSPIANVCGSSVDHTYLRGVGVSYAPSSYSELLNTCNTGDYQWSIGQGTMCAGGGGGGSSYAFGSGYTFSSTDLPSGQDTFQIKVHTVDGNEYEFTSSAGFVFVTHPMLIAYGTNPSSLTEVDYSAGNTTTGMDGARLAADPLIQVGSSDSLTLQFYRPQRLAIDGETVTDASAPFYDLAGFKYTPDIPNVQGIGKCDNLTATDSGLSGADTEVTTGTAPRMTVTWNLGTCWSSKGVSWTTGASDFDIQVTPQGPGGNSAQKVRITRT